jgi:hypothetical protein
MQYNGRKEHVTKNYAGLLHWSEISCVFTAFWQRSSQGSMTPGCRHQGIQPKRSLLMDQMKRFRAGQHQLRYQ